MSRTYYVTKDATGKRWDWLNLLAMKFPYTVYAVVPDSILGREFLHVASTMKAAKRVIEHDRAGERTVWRELDGREVLPDLREAELRDCQECTD